MHLLRERRFQQWAGRVLSALAVFPFIMSAGMKFMGGPEVLQGMEHLGLPETLIFPFAVLEALCVVVYLIPQTAILGAILFTGYVGGAILAHTRLGEPVFIQTALGVLLWLGLYLREPRLWALLPFRR